MPVFFLLPADGGALSQMGGEVCRWRAEHVEPVVGDGIVRAVWPSELDGFQAVISVEKGADEQAGWAVNAPRRRASRSPAQDQRGAELLEDLHGVVPGRADA